MTSREHWVASWACTPQLAEPENLPPGRFVAHGVVMAGATLRQSIRITLGGQRLRLRVSNLFGGADLPITAVSLANPAGARAGTTDILAGSAVPVTFAGSTSVTVAAGGQVVSDPVTLPVTAGSNLTVTMYLADGQASTALTSHPGSRTTSHLLTGDHVAATAMPGATAVEHWYFITGLDVLAPAGAATVVTLGDSLTDGRGSTTDGNDRWPDRLVERLHADPATAAVAVVNQAAGGNRVLRDGVGPAAVDRFDRDVLGQPGVRWLVVFEGVNDLGTAEAMPADQDAVVTDLIAAFDRFVTLAHARGVAVFAATLTPFGANEGYADAGGLREASRQRLNAWIRTSGRFDAVLDFDAAVRDAHDPVRLAAAYDCGDGLHLNPAGYQALAAAVPTTLFADR